jgi:hypothetical protein
MYLALFFYKNQTLGLCIYINVIYFFVMHENFVRTVFELLAKKHIPFFLCFAKKKDCSYVTVDEDQLHTV